MLLTVNPLLFTTACAVFTPSDPLVCSASNGFEDGGGGSQRIDLAGQPTANTVTQGSGLLTTTPQSNLSPADKLVQLFQLIPTSDPQKRHASLLIAALQLATQGCNRLGRRLDNFWHATMLVSELGHNEIMLSDNELAIRASVYERIRTKLHQFLSTEVTANPQLASRLEATLSILSNEVFREGRLTYTEAIQLFAKSFTAIYPSRS